MADIADLWRPTRRDVKSLKEQLATLKAGETIAAKFESARYGRFIVEGTVQLSSTNDLTVAGKFLGSAKAPFATLLSITPIEEVPAAPSTERAGVSHGAVVRATFENSGHGTFVITGTAVDAPVLGVTVLGAWFLAGEVCRQVELLADPGTHDQPVPNRILAITDDASDIV
ncbi:hypothetical protein [Microterricola viridarii]|uniref:Uncharacterized protein n=1 Tax=Microterricola viridarii TaxID=412690 RepID=A0A0Y0NYQ7_9MICO|nr:hypothetical protein [Microterricola viridarii]AMB59894.1 hypothetical protein AWU67_14665 [Microterricola viridarii]